MNCPFDQHPLRTLFEQDIDVEINTCDSCGGAWFDEDELTKAAEYFSVTLPPKHGKEMLALVNSHTLLEPSGHHCPKDGTLMNTYPYAGDSQVVIDHCESCGGFWFDGGELDKLKEYLRPTPDLDEMGKAIIREDNDFTAYLESIKTIPENIKAGWVVFLVSVIVQFVRNWESIKPSKETA